MRKSFTLGEIVTVIIILGILATLSIPIYTQVVENARAKVCETNLQVILGAVEARTLEENSFPASLSQLKNEDFEKSWAKVLKEKGSWKIKTAYFLVNFDQGGLSYASNQMNFPQGWINTYIKDPKVLICPANLRGGNSYGLNSFFATMTYADYMALLDNMPVVADSDTAVFTPGQISFRHKTGMFGDYYGQFIVKAKKVKKHNQD